MEITTPALLVNLDKLEANIRKMADFFRDKAANIRPMFKTPKCVPIAQMQIEVGAHGITCAKLSEAEVLVQGGIRDILIENQVVGPEKVWTAVTDNLRRSGKTICPRQRRTLKAAHGGG